MTEIKLQAEIAATEHQSAVPFSENLDQQRLDSRNMIMGMEESGIPIEDKEGVAQSLDVLRDQFGIEDAVFEQPKSKLVLTAIADRLNRVNNEQTVHGKKSAELEYIADLVMLAAGPHTAYANQYNSTMETQGVSDERVKAAHDKFTQPEVTRDMDEFIRGKTFDNLRTRLGISEEMPYEVRVLSIDSEGGGQSFGLIPHIDYWRDGEVTSEEYDELVKEGDLHKDYIEGLEENGKAFNAALGREGEFAPAWVSTFRDGTVYLCLALPTAEKVLYTEEERATFYDDDDRLRDVALVEHEYTHTQKSLLFDEHVGLGIALEELRAEHFSGNKHGYTDIKKFFMGLDVINDYSVVSSFEKDDTSYDEERFLTEIAQKTGLDGLLDAMTTIPGNYAEDEHASPYLRAVVEHNGGSLSAYFQTLYEKAQRKHGAKVVEARIDAMVDKLKDRFKGSEYASVESFLHYGGIASLGSIGSENLRRRYPDESDRYDYINHKSL